jgi:hypothetical protein
VSDTYCDDCQSYACGTECFRRQLEYKNSEIEKLREELEIANAAIKLFPKIQHANSDLLAHADKLAAAITNAKVSLSCTNDVCRSTHRSLRSALAEHEKFKGEK